MVPSFFAPGTIRSREQKFQPEILVFGNFIAWNFRSLELSLPIPCRENCPGKSGTFIPFWSMLNLASYRVVL